MNDIEYLRECGKIHQEIKENLKQFIKPNMKIIDIVNHIEDNIKYKTNYNSDKHLESGIAFPTGFSINNCAAHWTPEKNNQDILKNDDIVKIDFGIHKKGYIIDSAFTFSFNENYQELIQSSIEANTQAIKESGPEAILGEIGKNIQEIIESYEIEINNKIYPLKSIEDLTGHSISRYNIHSGKAVPNINIPFYQLRMKEGEVYAIEPFATTGKGKVISDNNNCSHYMIKNINLKDPRINQKEIDFIKKIYKKYFTLPFCKRWLEQENINYSLLEKLSNMGIINSYPPLYDIKNSYVSQHENTIIIKNKGVEILT